MVCLVPLHSGADLINNSHFRCTEKYCLNFDAYARGDFMDKIVYLLSGEYILNWRPNGGTAVLLRSLLVTVLLYALAIPIKSYCEKGAVLEFSFNQFKIEIGNTLPWLGAIFAGSYAAFYTRFAAQWNYLAGLYNQIMAACVPLNEKERTNNRALNIWRAAFVEDAQDLHLAGKSMFRSVIIAYLQRDRVVEVFLSSTADGKERIAQLEQQLNFTAAVPGSGTQANVASA
jgi:hypothetical protein